MTKPFDRYTSTDIAMLDPAEVARQAQSFEVDRTPGQAAAHRYLARKPRPVSPLTLYALFMVLVMVGIVVIGVLVT